VAEPYDHESEPARPPVPDPGTHRGEGPLSQGNLALLCEIEARDRDLVQAKLSQALAKYLRKNFATLESEI
jgi:hypothetical protein